MKLKIIVGKKKFTWRAWVAGFLVPVFVLTTIVQGGLVFAAAGEANQLTEIPALKSLKSLVLPESLGQLEDVFEASENSPKIILIQDAHAVPDAQRSIRQLLLYLQKEYGISRVAVEGAAQKLDPQMFASFPDKDVLAKVLRATMNRGELSGSVAAALMGVNDPVVQPDYFGVEDWKLYEEALELYLKGMAGQEAAVKLVDGKLEELKKVKTIKYSKELLSVDEAEVKFRENEKELLDFLQDLARVMAPESNSEIALFLAEAEKQESGQDDLEKEILQVVENFKPELTRLMPEDRRIFNRQWQSYQTGEIQAAQFALTLNELGARNNVDLLMSKKMLSGVKIQKRLRDVEGTHFFKSLEHYTRAIKESLFESEENRRLDQETHELLLRKKLAMLELSREEWEEVKYAADIWKKNLEAPIAFYRNAEKRDDVFFENLVRAAKPGENLVMIAGGFHSQGLIDRFKKAGMAYALVMPSIAHLPEKSNYREHMQGDVSWKSYFKVENGRVNLYEPFVRYMRDQLLGDSHESSVLSLEGKNKSDSMPGIKNQRLLKDWRDQLIRDLSRAGRIEEAGNYTRFLDEKVKQSDSTIPEGLQKLEKFFDGLRTLDSEGRFQAPNILQLLKTANVPSGPVAGALTHASLAIGAMSEVRQQPASRVSELATQEAGYPVPRTARSEMRVSSAEKKYTKDNVRIVFAEDMELFWMEQFEGLSLAGYNVTVVHDLNGLKDEMEGPEGLPEILILDRHLEHGQDAVRYVAGLRKKGIPIGNDQDGTLVIWNSFTSPKGEDEEVLIQQGVYDGRRPLSEVKGKAVTGDILADQIEKAIAILNERPVASVSPMPIALPAKQIIPIDSEDKNRAELIRSINEVIGLDLTDRNGMEFNVSLPDSAAAITTDIASAVTLRLTHLTTVADVSFDTSNNMIRFTHLSQFYADPIKMAMLMRLMLEFSARLQVLNGDLYMESVVEDRSTLVALALQMRENLSRLLPQEILAEIRGNESAEQLITLLEDFVSRPQGVKGVEVDPSVLVEGEKVSATADWQFHESFGLVHALEIIDRKGVPAAILVTKQLNSRFVLHQLKGVLSALTGVLVESIERNNGIVNLGAIGRGFFDRAPVFYQELSHLDNLHARKSIREAMTLVEEIYMAFSVEQIGVTLKNLKGRLPQSDLEDIENTAYFVREAAADWLGLKEDFFQDTTLGAFIGKVSRLVAPEKDGIVQVVWSDEKLKKRHVEIMPRALTEIIINLVKNSREAVLKRQADLGAQGSAYIPKIALLIGKGAKESFRIRIIDNGSGMTSDQVDKANRGVSFTSGDKSDGTGVGLHSSHNLVVGKFHGIWEVTSVLATLQKDGETQIIMTLPNRASKRSEVRMSEVGRGFPLMRFSNGAQAETLTFTPENRQRLWKLSREAKRFFITALNDENDVISDAFRFGVNSHDPRDAMWVVSGNDSNPTLLGLQQVERLPNFYLYESEISKLPKGEQLATGVIVLDKSLRGQGLGVQLKKAAFQYLASTGVSFYYAVIAGGTQENRASYQMTLSAANDLNLPVYQMSKSDEFLIQLRPDVLDPETPDFLRTLIKVTTAKSEVRVLSPGENVSYTQSFNLTETPAFQKVMDDFRGEPGTAIRDKLQEQDVRNPPELPSQAQSKAFLKELGTWAGLEGPAFLSFAGGFDVMKPRAIAGDVTDVISFGLQPFGSSEDVVNVMAASLTVGDINLWRLLQGGAFDTPQHLKVLLEHKKIIKPEGGGLGGLAVARLSLAESEPSGEIRSIRYFKIKEDQTLEFMVDENISDKGSAVIEYRVSELAPWQRFWYVNLDLANAAKTRLFESFIQRFQIGGVLISAPMRIFEESETAENALELLHAMNPATPILSDQSATSDGKAMPFQPQHSFWLPDQPSRRELTTNGLGIGYSNPRSFNFNLPAIPGYFAYAGTVANVKKVRSEVRNAPTDIELEVRAQMLYPWDEIHSKNLQLDDYDKKNYTFFPNAKDSETGFWKRNGMPQGVELVLGTWEDIKRKTDPDHRYNYPGMDFQSMQRHVVMRYQTADGKRMSFYAYDDHVYSLPYALEARERGEIQEKGNRHLFLDDHPDNFKVPEPRRPSTAQAALKLIADDQGMINDPRMNNFNSLWPEDFFEEHVLIYDKRVATTYNARRRSGIIHRGEPLQGGTPVLEMDWTLYPHHPNRIRVNDQNVFVDIDTDMTGGGDSLAGVLPDAESVLQTYVDFLSKLVFEDGVTPALVHASTTKGQGAPYGDVEIVRYLLRVAPLLFLAQGDLTSAEVLTDVKEIRKQHEPYVRSHLRSEVRSTRVVAEELKLTGESLAEYYVYGQVTAEILSDISEQLEKAHKDITLEQIIKIIRTIVTNKIQHIQLKEARAAAHKIRNTLRSEDTLLLQGIVHDNLTADFKNLNGGYIVGATLSPEDGKTMAANLIAAVQKLYASGALKHALVAAADPAQRQAIAEERSKSELPIDVLEVLNKLPGPAILSNHFENGQTRLPNAVRAEENKQQIGGGLVPVELLGDTDGLSVSDLEMLEVVSVFMQLAAGAVIAREANSNPDEIRGKLNQLFQVKGAEIDDKILNAVFVARGEGFSLSQLGLLGVLRVLQTQYVAIQAMRTAA